MITVWRLCKKGRETNQINVINIECETKSKGDGEVFCGEGASVGERVLQSNAGGRRAGETSRRWEKCLWIIC